MKPVAFDIVRPQTTREASQLLASASDGVRVVAGSQSLGPMLNLRLVQPRLLCDVTGIEELASFREGADALFIGACVTTGSIEDKRLPLQGFGMLPDIAAGIAYRAVRNRGTIGGSICHADPAADWPSALCGLNASCIVLKTNGDRRTIAMSDFITGAFETALAPGELLVGVTIPRRSRQAKWGYQKLCRKAGEFASAIAVVSIDPEKEQFRLVFGATEGRHLIIPDFRTLCEPGRAAPDIGSVGDILGKAGLSATHNSQQLAMMKRAFSQAGAPCES
jgi:aerobic carbon-monoxide dehydrogenase medium subunit